MARLVRHDATGPRKLDEDDIDDEKGDVAVCQCGLADSFPFCDGSHRATREESDADLYCYESGADGRSRRVVADVVLAED